MGERRFGEEVVGDPVGELRQRVRRARRDDQQVGLRQVRIEILGGRPARQRQERPLGDELLRARRDERHDVVPGLDEQARHLARLVRGDPSTDSEQNPAHEGSVTYFLGYE